MNVFREETSTDDNQTYKLYTADVWAVWDVKSALSL